MKAAAAVAAAFLAFAAAAQPAPPRPPGATPPSLAPGAAPTAAPRARPLPPAEPVSFEEAVRRATLQSVSAIIAADEVRRADAILWEVRASSLPLVTGNASYTLLDAPRIAAGSTSAVVAKDTWNGNLTAQAPLIGASRWAAWAHAAEQIDVARASEADVRRAVALTAGRAYLSILAQKRLIDVSRSAREIARARFDFAHARRVGGIGNVVDELRAEQQLATSEVQLAAGELGLVRAQEALGVIAGAAQPLDAVAEPTFAPAPVADAVAAAEGQRLDVKAARARLTAAQHIARDSWLDWLPTLLATAQGFLNSPATVSNPQNGWSVQFLLSLPIFEGGFRVGQQRERDLLAEESRVSLEGTLTQVRSDVRVGIEEVARQEAALEQARIAATRARSALQLVIEAYRAGATNDLDVSTAQQQSRDADLAAVIVEDGVRQSRLDLLAALGQFP